jgi:hypothetical protein
MDRLGIGNMMYMIERGQCCVREGRRSVDVHQPIRVVATSVDPITDEARQETKQGKNEAGWEVDVSKESSTGYHLPIAN